MKNKLSLVILLLILVTTFIMLVMNAVHFIRGRIMLSSFMSNMDIVSTDCKPESVRYDCILRTRDLVTKFLKDTGPFVFFDLRTRPLLGYKVKDILRHGEGQCGESARLLYHIFREQGILCRRVYLYGAGRQHVVLELLLNDRWVILDTNNTRQDFYETTTTGNLSMSDLFNTDMKYGIIEPTQLNRFYSSYSYFNIAKLFSFLGWTTLVHRPMPAFFIYVYETPSFFYILMCLCVISADSILLIRVIRKKKVASSEKTLV